MLHILYVYVFFVYHLLLLFRHSGLLLNKKINSYDLLLNGNMGYKGEDSVINYFDSLDSNTYFLLNLDNGY